MVNRNTYVYDIETLKSCFTYIGYNIDTKEIVQFVVHKDRNDIKELLKHLSECKGQIGFNNIGFDYPVLHELLIWNNEYELNAENIIEVIYNKAQSIIENQNKDIKDLSYIKEKDYKIKQLDLFKLWHYNNKARSCSLKNLQISMNYPNVMECDVPFDKEDITLEEVDQILEYNLNDVMSTYEFYLKSFDKIKLRKDLNSKYNLNCINFSDSKIGESLTLKLYCDKTGLDIWDVKKLRTYRKSINLGKCIFNYISFKSKEFSNLLDTFKNKIITETKGAIEESVVYKGFKYDFGTGGIHGCIKSGVYQSSDTHIIIDLDVASLYPSIAILNNLYPLHLGKDFCEVYKGILDQRIEAKNNKNMVLSDGLKLSLNSVYGKSNDVFSFLYDPEYTMRTTLNGQLLLCMLAEELVDQIEDIEMLQINTDGLTVKLNKNNLELYKQICKDWETKTKLTLEFVEYSKMVIRDVNNYSALTIDGKYKYKGAFEIDKVVGSEPAYHKDNSFKIIPIALKEYFFNNIPIETTIKNHQNIYDFCGRQKFKGQDFGELHYIEPFGQELIKEKQQKHTRYYVSKDAGATFIKNYAKGSIEKIHAGYKVIIFNKYFKRNIESYDLNYQFYIKECNKELQLIENKQLELF